MGFAISGPKSVLAPTPMKIMIGKTPVSMPKRKWPFRSPFALFSFCSRRRPRRCRREGLDVGLFTGKCASAPRRFTVANSWRGTRWGVGPACAAVSAALPPQARSEVKSYVGPVLTSRAEGGGEFFAHRAFAVVRVVPKVAIDGYIKIFSLESWARQKSGEGYSRCFLMGVGRVARRPRLARECRS